MNRKRTNLIAICLIIFAFTPAIALETFCLQQIPSDKFRLGIKFSHPNFDTDTDISTMTGVYELSLNIPVNMAMNFLVNVPYIKIKYDKMTYSGSHEYSESGIGNIFLGIQSRHKHSSSNQSVTTIGVALPTADEDVAPFGVYCDYYGFSKYLPDASSITLNYAFHSISRQGLKFGIELGPDAYIPTGDNKGNTELLMHYGASLGLQSQQIVLNISFIALGILSEKDLDYTERFNHSLNFGVGYINRNWTPKVFYKLYMDDDMKNIVNNVFGLGASITP